jgi:hydrophobic/amphiphilic exporter-1 (mainly G- bacteria), HAE1 family
VRSLYQSPLRVYLALLFLALLGIWAGINLPVSLFPNSSKPTVAVNLSYGNLTSDEFLIAHGKKIESNLRQTTVDGHGVDNLVAQYNRSGVSYELEFAWGTPGTQAVKEVESNMTSLVSGMTEEVRDSLGVYTWNQNSGFFVLMFYSQERSLDELYKYLDPILSPKMARVVDAEGVGLWNPNQKVIRLELNPEKMALLQILPDDVQRSLNRSIRSFSGGNVSIKDSSYAVVMDRQISTLDELNQLPIKASTGQIVHLSDIAQIEYGISTTHQIHKTSGASAVSLYGSPKADGNIKKMSEDIMAVIKEIEPDLPKDISYRVIIDPSEFIRHAVNNVLHEVFIAAFLAVLVLFIFIGNIRNVITAAIEIPISIVLAFIMMKLFGINLNMISLGGLALSAGMNVDASVVVMENIFRRFEEWKGPLTAKDRLNLVVEAVQEVKLPVIASTIASLVVFLPLALTSGLTNAVLGDSWPWSSRMDFLHSSH